MFDVFFLIPGLLVCGIFLKSHSLNPDDIVSQVSNYLPYYQVAKPGHI